MVKTLKQLKLEQRRLKLQAKKIDKRLFTLECLIWDLEVAAVKPSQMCRNRWSPGFSCALKINHKGCCQGNAPRLVYK